MKIKDVIGGIKEKEIDKNITNPKLKELDSNIVYTHNELLNTEVSVDGKEIDDILQTWLIFHYGNTGMTDNNINKLKKLLMESIKQGKIVRRNNAR